MRGMTPFWLFRNRSHNSYSRKTKWAPTILVVLFFQSWENTGCQIASSQSLYLFHLRLGWRKFLQRGTTSIFRVGRSLSTKKYTCVAVEHTHFSLQNLLSEAGIFPNFYANQPSHLTQKIASLTCPAPCLNKQARHTPTALSHNFSSHQKPESVISVAHAEKKIHLLPRHTHLAFATLSPFLRQTISPAEPKIGVCGNVCARFRAFFLVGEWGKYGRIVISRKNERGKSVWSAYAISPFLLCSGFFSFVRAQAKSKATWVGVGLLLHSWGEISPSLAAGL